MNVNLKAVLTFLFSVAKLVDDAVAKGLSLSEIGESIEVLRSAPIAYEDLGAAGQEYLNLDAAGRADLEAFISQGFSINEAAVQQVIDVLLDFGVELEAVLQLFKK